MGGVEMRDGGGKEERRVGKRRKGWEEGEGERSGGREGRRGSLLHSWTINDFHEG